MMTCRPLCVALWLLLSACVPRGATAGPPVQEWFPRADPLPSPRGGIVHVTNVAQLHDAVNRARGGENILIHDGHYALQHTLDVHTSGIVLRSASGNRDRVVLDAAKNRHGEVVMFSRCADVIVADLTIQNAAYNGFKINNDKGARRIRIRNCVIHNIWQRGVKSVRIAEPVVDQCIVENCLFYNDRPKQFSDDPTDRPSTFDGNYIGGIDAQSAMGWKIRDNAFVNIQGRTREGRGAVFLWHGAYACLVERNIFVDCDRGICLGNAQLVSGFEWHCAGCVVRNNFITRAPEEAVFAAFTKDCQISHNSIFDPENRRRRSIRVFNRNEQLEISNNLIAGPQLNLKTDNPILAFGNNFDAGDAFVDPRAGNLHLKRPGPRVDLTRQLQFDVTHDIDAQPRTGAADVGADQFLLEDKR